MRGGAHSTINYGPNDEPAVDMLVSQENWIEQGGRTHFQATSHFKIIINANGDVILEQGGAVETRCL